jgi:hypothetical protein
LLQFYLSSVFRFFPMRVDYRVKKVMINLWSTVSGKPINFVRSLTAIYFIVFDHLFESLYPALKEARQRIKSDSVNLIGHDRERLPAWTNSDSAMALVPVRKIRGYLCCSSVNRADGQVFELDSASVVRCLRPFCDSRREFSSVSGACLRFSDCSLRYCFQKSYVQ